MAEMATGAASGADSSVVAGRMTGAASGSVTATGPASVGGSGAANPTVAAEATPSTPTPTASGNGNEAGTGGGVTQAQLRRFIKSRPYVPMHELRRRFELNGAADEVCPIHVSGGVVYVGLPSRESGFIAELVRQGEVGVELSYDPPVPIVVGVYAMRPIAR